MSLDDVPRCQHVKVNGTQCGSPALRRRRYCFFHDKVRRERGRIAAETSAQRRFNLPLLEDANSVQVALMKVMQMLGSGTMDHRTAGLMLYALQTASINLRHTDFEANDVTDVVIDRDTVNATCINGPQWFEEDFEAEGDDNDDNVDEEQNDLEAEADREDADSIQANAPSAGNPVAKTEKKQASSEQAKKQVQKVVENWPSDTLTQKTQ
jgi:hypothetical protein